MFHGVDFVGRMILFGKQICKYIKKKQYTYFFSFFSGGGMPQKDSLFLFYGAKAVISLFPVMPLAFSASTAFIFRSSLALLFSILFTYTVQVYS